MNLLDRVRDAIHRYRVWRRRRILLAAYRKEFRALTGKRVGFTPTMAAWERAQEEGYLTIDDGIKWHWPEEEAPEPVPEYDFTSIEYVHPVDAPEPKVLTVHLRFDDDRFLCTTQDSIWLEAPESEETAAGEGGVA